MSSHPCPLHSPPLPSTHPTQQGTAATHPLASPLSSQMTNHSFSAGLRAISRRGHDRFTPEEVKRTPSHPTQACYCSGPRFIRCYKNNRAVQISEPTCRGCSMRELSRTALCKVLLCARIWTWERFKGLVHLKMMFRPLTTKHFVD